MRYTKINLELIVPAEEADAVAAELSAALDRMEETRTLFGGGIEAVHVDHAGRRRKSALMHTKAAVGTAGAAVNLAGERVAAALKTII